jgi:hypothetical protein
VAIRCGLAGQPVGRHRAQRLLEDQAALQPRQRGAEAVVDPLAEGHVAPRRAGEVELVGALPAAFVAVGGAPQQRDRVSGRDGDLSPLAWRRRAARSPRGTSAGGAAGAPDRPRRPANDDFCLHAMHFSSFTRGRT